MNKNYDEQIMDALMELLSLMIRKEQILNAVARVKSLVYSGEQSRRVKEGIRRKREEDSQKGEDSK